jgi:hypothetical protein
VNWWFQNPTTIFGLPVIPACTLEGLLAELKGRLERRGHAVIVVAEATGQGLMRFGGPFLVWYPSKYAKLLAAKIKTHGARVWFVNTGWSGGAYGVGKRIKLAFTRAIIDAIHSSALASAKSQQDPISGLAAVALRNSYSAECLVR